MSVPRSLALSPEVSPARVAVASGELAALVATPPNDVPLRPPVLAVPGYTGSKEDFIHLLPLLARAGYPATAVDLRGQYESGGPEDQAAYTVEMLGKDVASLLSAGEPSHVVGHSFGGLVCREAALAGAPARSLTLLGSGPGALGGHRARLVEGMRGVLLDGGIRALDEAARALDAQDPRKAALPAEVKDFLSRRLLATPVAGLLGMGAALTTAPDRTTELRDSGLPVLVAYGEADDAWSPAEQAEMAERLGARRVVFAGRGHSPAVEDEQAVAAALLEFWASVDAAA